MKQVPSHCSAFGLTELFAFVALLIIVFGTLIPMRNRAVVRSGIARSIADVMRIGAALDIYRMDNNQYPPSVDAPFRTPMPEAIYGKNFLPPLTSHRMALTRLTTPIAYLPNVSFNAPFASRAWEITEAERRGDAHSYWYCNYSDFWQTARGDVTPYPLEGYLVMAFGPRSSGVAGISAPYRDLLSTNMGVPAFSRPNSRHVYDPTNGLMSAGNIPRFGGKLGLESGVPYFPSIDAE